jgi:hypothetical protein
LLTPFYFIRAGSFVSVPALIAAPLVFVSLFFAKMTSKLAGILPTVRAFGYDGDVYRTYVRDYLRLVRLESRHHQSGAVFASGRDRDRQRGDSDGYRKRPIHAETFVARKQRTLTASVYGEPVGDLDAR